MKKIIIILFFCNPCFANNWPLDYEPNIPSLLDPKNPYVDEVALENLALEQLSEQINESTENIPESASIEQPVAEN